MASSHEMNQFVRPRRLPIMCQKTKICKYHAWGICARGAQCGFAHGESELQPVPDLSRTKPCPALVNVGVCEDPECTFAHHKEELRAFPLSKSRIRDKTAERTFEAACVPRTNGMSGYRSGSTDGRSDEDSSTRASETEGQPAVISQRFGAAASEFGCTPLFGVVPPIVGDFAPLARPPVTIQATESMVVGHEHDSVVNVPESAPAPRSKFEKTKLCTFFFTGRCKKRGRCAFAHSEAELRPLPDLSFTKMCPKVLEGGECGELDCTYAHTEEELRQDAGQGNKKASVASCPEDIPRADDQQLQDTEQLAVDETSSVNSDVLNDDLNTDLDLEPLGGGWRRQQTEDPVAMRVRMMRVKNTFITIDEEEENEQDGEKLPRKLNRSKSAPALMRLDSLHGQSKSASRHQAEAQPMTSAAAMPPSNLDSLQGPCQPAARLPRPASRVAGSTQPVLDVPLLVQPTLSQGLPPTRQAAPPFRFNGSGATLPRAAMPGAPQPVLEVPSLARPAVSQGPPTAQVGPPSRFAGGAVTLPRAAMLGAPEPGPEPFSLGEPLFIQPSWGFPSMLSPPRQDVPQPEMKPMWQQKFQRFPGGLSPMAHLTPLEAMVQLTPLQAMLVPASAQVMTNRRF